MYKRIILLKSPDTAPLSVLLQELHGFPRRIPGQVSVEVIADSGDRSLGFDQGFILTYTDESVPPPRLASPPPARRVSPKVTRAVPDADFRLPAHRPVAAGGSPPCLRLSTPPRSWWPAAPPVSVLPSPNSSINREPLSPWPAAVQHA